MCVHAHNTYIPVVHTIHSMSKSPSIKSNHMVLNHTGKWKHIDSGNHIGTKPPHWLVLSVYIQDDRTLPIGQSDAYILKTHTPCHIRWQNWLLKKKMQRWLRATIDFSQPPTPSCPAATQTNTRVTPSINMNTIHNNTSDDVCHYANFHHTHSNKSTKL